MENSRWMLNYLRESYSVNDVKYFVATTRNDKIVVACYGQTVSIWLLPCMLMSSEAFISL